MRPSDRTSISLLGFLGTLAGAYAQAENSETGIVAIALVVVCSAAGIVCASLVSVTIYCFYRNHQRERPVRASVEEEVYLLSKPINLAQSEFVLFRISQVSPATTNPSAASSQSVNSIPDVVLPEIVVEATQPDNLTKKIEQQREGETSAHSQSVTASSKHKDRKRTKPRVDGQGSFLQRVVIHDLAEISPDERYVTLAGHKVVRTATGEVVVSDGKHSVTIPPVEHAHQLTLQNPQTLPETFPNPLIPSSAPQDSQATRALSLPSSVTEEERPPMLHIAEVKESEVDGNLPTLQHEASFRRAVPVEVDQGTGIGITQQ